LAVERASAPTVERLEVSAYTVPTETQEADGTLAWKETTLVLAGVSAGGIRDRPDNLLDPVPGDFGAHGILGQQVRQSATAT
jgi:hypothetical protein